MAPTLPRDPVKEMFDNFVSAPLTAETQNKPHEFKTAAQLSLAAYKVARAAQKELEDARLRAISEGEAKKKGNDPITAAYLRQLPKKAQRRLHRMPDAKFRRAILEIARRAHALHESGAFKMPEVADEARSV